jgi:phosphoglycerol transferase MdoB-like AlkP superfamily enzyme
MLPKGYLRYTFSTPIFLFTVFITGYILGGMRTGFMASLYKLAFILIMLFILLKIIPWARNKYWLWNVKRRIAKGLRYKPEFP